MLKFEKKILRRKVKRLNKNRARREICGLRKRKFPGKRVFILALCSDYHSLLNLSVTVTCDNVKLFRVFITKCYAKKRNRLSRISIRLLGLWSLFPFLDWYLLSVLCPTLLSLRMVSKSRSKQGAQTRGFKNH